MRALIQRVKYASVTINDLEYSSINQGLLCFLGITHTDTKSTADKLLHKLVGLRIFPDEQQKMNLSLINSTQNILVVSQFTLYADTTKGMRPSFMKSAHPTYAEPLYHYFLMNLSTKYNLNVQSGQFGAMMDVQLVNWGPVTIFLEENNE